MVLKEVALNVGNGQGERS